MRDNTLKIIIKILIKSNTLYYTCILIAVLRIYIKSLFWAYTILCVIILSTHTYIDFLIINISIFCFQLNTIYNHYEIIECFDMGGKQKKKISLNSIFFLLILKRSTL